LLLLYFKEKLLSEYVYSSTLNGWETGMKKILNLIFFMSILVSIFLTGCNESESITVDSQSKVVINSEIVELVDSELIFNKIGNVIKNVDLKYRFRNLLDKKIDLYIYAEFLDKNGNIISKEGPKEISLLPNYTEQSFGGANTISFNGVGVRDVDNARLLVEDIS
jgi:hypothetical protein